MYDIILVMVKQKTDTPQKASAKSLTWLYVVSGIFVVVLIALGIYIYFNGMPWIKTDNSIYFNIKW